MELVRDVVSYLGARFPRDHKLSLTRLMRMMFLAEWRSWIVRGKALTNLKWTIQAFGPFSEELLSELRSDFVLEKTTNEYGKPKSVVRVSESAPSNLPPEEREVIDFVLGATALKWDQLTELVYSTYPLMVVAKGEAVDFKKLSSEYAHVRDKILSTEQ